MRRRGLALVLVGLMVFVVAGAASAGGHIASCDGFDGNVKFDSDVIGVEGVTLAVDGVAVTLNDWVTKEGEPDEFVGFSMTFDEGSFEMAYVKAGRDFLSFDATSGTWMNSGEKVRAISHVQFCGASIGDGGGGISGVTETTMLEG